MTSLCVSLVVDHDLLKDWHTHRWRQIHVRSCQLTYFSFIFMPWKSFNKLFEFLLYKTNKWHFSVHVYCNRSQKTSQHVENKGHATRLHLVSYFLFFTVAMSSVIYDGTYAQKNVIYFLNFICWMWWHNVNVM